ncbi:uncharacterized protein [Leptinotarsa decemlineata]|uniref:uncharacterized protein n=1 Tax=Leptinotarsa decemlineata TaxID=7539 RepID=UPI003D304B9C
MDPTTMIEETVKSMKCHFCKQLLSFPPIFINCQEGSKNKCGRCISVKNGEWVRNQVFESVAECLMYPCMYCGEIVPWAQVEQHETNCEHKTILCPFTYTGCAEDVEIPDIEAHVRDQHPRKLFRDKITYEINIRKQTTPLLLIVEDSQFIVYILRDSIFVGHLGPIREYSFFNVDFSSENGNRCVSYKNKDIVEFNERLHCYECIKERCEADHHPFSKKYTKPPVHPGASPFSLASMMELLNNPTQIKVTISVVPNQDVKQDHRKELSFKDFGISIRRHIECPICMEYLFGPIFSCKKGHGICRKCKAKINLCPSCKSEYEGSRCFQLEDLIENIKISCPNKGWGCNIVGNLQRILCHKTACEFKCTSLPQV